jgi:hypothetical protein
MTYQTIMMGFLTFALIFAGWLYEVLPIRFIIYGGGLLTVAGAYFYFIFMLITTLSQTKQQISTGFFRSNNLGHIYIPLLLALLKKRLSNI